VSDFVWLDGHEIRAIQLELIAEHGGMAGIRDEGLLESALARPQNLPAYGSPELAELAAAYGFGLAKNHASIDGHKRIALAAIAVFLDVNGYELIASQAEAVETILGIAESRLTEADLALWIARNVRPLKDELPSRLFYSVFANRLKKLSVFHSGRTGSLATRSSKAAMMRSNLAAASLSTGCFRSSLGL
jgi:death-on-curing protein